MNDINIISIKIIFIEKIKKRRFSTQIPYIWANPYLYILV